MNSEPSSLIGVYELPLPLTPAGPGMEDYDQRACCYAATVLRDEAAALLRTITDTTSEHLATRLRALAAHLTEAADYLNCR